MSTKKLVALIAAMLSVGCCLRASPKPSKKPKLMYAWTLPGSNVVRTCQLGEQFVDKAGQIYVCGQWPPYERERAK